MQDGIYHVNFSSSTGDFGEGLVVVKDGSVNGGDTGFLYRGQLSSNGGDLCGKFNVMLWNPGHKSVFGPIDNFNLNLTGQTGQNNSFSISGAIDSHPHFTININGRYLSTVA